MSDHNIIILSKREDPFARVPKTVLDDERLSWKAKGILSYLLGKPTEWKVRVKDLSNKSTDGEASIRSALAELRKLGYAELERQTGRGVVLEWVWKVSDSCIFKPDCGFPHVDKPHVDNHYISKNECNKKEVSKKESKESKETSPSDDVFPPTWKPNPKDRKAQLATIRPPEDYPSQVEFDVFCDSEGISGVFANYRSDLYGDLCRSKWSQWKLGANRWVPIGDWRGYVSSLACHIEGAH